MATFTIAESQRNIAKCQRDLRSAGATPNSREFSRTLIQRYRTAIEMLEEGQNPSDVYRYVQNGSPLGSLSRYA